MQLMAVVGSPRKGGNTEVLVDRVIEGYLSEADAAVVKIVVTDKRIGYCRGCLSCTFPPPGTGTCVIEDDMTDILQQMLASDIFIFGTPNHMRTVSAPLLTFFSRMLPLMEFKPDLDAQGNVIGGGFTSKLSGKKAAVVISQGDPIFSSALVYEVLERNLVDMGLRRVGDVISRGNMHPGDVSANAADIARAVALGRSLVTSAGMY